MFVLIASTVAVTAGDGLRHVVPIVGKDRARFLAEVGRSSGRPALVDMTAKTDVQTFFIS